MVKVLLSLFVSETKCEHIGKKIEEKCYRKNMNNKKGPFIKRKGRYASLILWEFFFSLLFFNKKTFKED